MNTPSPNIRQYPFLKALIALVAGIVCASYISLPIYVIILAAALLLAVAWLVSRPVAGYAMMLALMCMGMFSAELSKGDALPPSGREIYVEISRISSERGAYSLGEAHIRSMRGADGWQRCDVRVRFRCDSALHVTESESFRLLASIKPFSADSENSYESSMARQGFRGELRIGQHQVLERVADEPTWGESMRAYAKRRVAQLGLSAEVEGVVEAMSIGEYRHLSSALRQDYSRSGMSHLLAISGLHLSFIFVIVNLLFRWVTLFRHGQILLSVLVVCAVWAYALMAGFSASVLRAAIMFSLFQLLSLLSRRGYSIESLALTACVMLLLDSSTLYDIGFQLSFVAVVAILVWGTTWCSLLLRKEPLEHAPGVQPLRLRLLRRLGRWLWSAFAISAAATLAVMPLCSYYFGVVSLWSLLTSPAMVALSGAVVCLVFVWIILPFDFAAPLFGTLMEWFVGLMNFTAEACSSLGWLNAEWRMSLWECVVAYGVMLLLTLLLRHKKIRLSRL